MPRVRGQTPEANQNIVRKEEVGNVREWEQTLATTVPKVPSQPVLSHAFPW